MRRRRPRFTKPVTLPKWALWLVVILWWGLLITLVMVIDPVRMRDVVFTGLYFPFLLLVFIAISGTLFLLRKRFWPSVLWATGVSVFLLLRLYGWGNIVNLLVIGMCLAVWEVYWRYLDLLKSREKEEHESYQEPIIDSP
jgi:hypothetical protein